MAEEEKPATIIDLKSLMAEQIEGDAPPVEAFNGNPEKKTEDFLGVQVEEEEEEEDPKPKSEEEEEEEIPKPTPEDEEDPKPKPEEEEEDPKPKAEGEEDEEVELSEYTTTLKNLFGEGISHIVQEDEKGEPVEVALEDVEMTQELYEEILKAKMSELQEEAKKGTVSTEGISEFTRELIEIDRAGGDVDTLLEVKRTYTDVLEGLDLTKKEDQKQAVFLRYKAGDQYSDEEIDILIEGYETKGILGDKAESAERELTTAVQQQVEQAKQTALDKKADLAKLTKEYEKEIEESLDQFELEDKLKRKIAKLSVKKDDKDRFEIDNMYFLMKQDPKKAAQLALFILDTEEYNKQIGKDVKKETQLNTAGKLSLIKKKTSSVGEAKTRTKKKEGESIDLLKLNSE